MAILPRHLRLYDEVFRLPGILAEPFLMIGYQDILGSENPPFYDHPDLRALLTAAGLTEILALDRFDDRAELRYDLNLPLPEAEHERFRVVFDIGSLEHVFDTRQCLENCMRMVKPDGLYFLHTPVKGFYDHGLHTFSPELVIQAFERNGFAIEYLAFSSDGGERLEDAGDADDSLIWIVGKKRRALVQFAIPQQGRWRYEYLPKEPEVAPAQSGDERNRPRWVGLVRQLLPPIAVTAGRRIRRLLRR